MAGEARRDDAVRQPPPGDLPLRRRTTSFPGAPGSVVGPTGHRQGACRRCADRCRAGSPPAPEASERRGAPLAAPPGARAGDRADRQPQTCSMPPDASCSRSRHEVTFAQTDAGDRGRVREPQRAAGVASRRGARLAAGRRRRRAAAAGVPRRVHVPRRAVRAARSPSRRIAAARTPPGKSRGASRRPWCVRRRSSRSGRWSGFIAATFESCCRSRAARRMGPGPALGGGGEARGMADRRHRRHPDPTRPAPDRELV